MSSFADYSRNPVRSLHVRFRYVFSSETNVFSATTATDVSFSQSVPINNIPNLFVPSPFYLSPANRLSQFVRRILAFVSPYSNTVRCRRHLVITTPLYPEIQNVDRNPTDWRDIAFAQNVLFRLRCHNNNSVPQNVGLLLLQFILMHFVLYTDDQYDIVLYTHGRPVQFPPGNVVNYNDNIICIHVFMAGHFPFFSSLVPSSRKSSYILI